MRKFNNKSNFQHIFKIFFLLSNLFLLLSCGPKVPVTNTPNKNNNSNVPKTSSTSSEQTTNTNGPEKISPGNKKQPSEEKEQAKTPEELEQEALLNKMKENAEEAIQRCEKNYIGVENAREIFIKELNNLPNTPTVKKDKKVFLLAFDNKKEEFKKFLDTEILKIRNEKRPKKIQELVAEFSSNCVRFKMIDHFPYWVVKDMFKEYETIFKDWVKEAETKLKNK